MRAWMCVAIVGGGVGIAGLGCGRDSAVFRKDAASPPISSGGTVGSGGSNGSGGITVAGGTGGMLGDGGTALGGSAAKGTGGAAVGDAAGNACSGVAKSSLPGVSIVFPDGPCSFTLAEVAAGISITYELRIEESLDGVHPAPFDFGRCGEPDASGLIVGFEIAGDAANSYCLCDVGKCKARTFSTRTVPGTYPATIPWDGRNWQGPSDTNNHEGAAFPPGTYTLTVMAKGTWNSPGSCDGGVCSVDGGAVQDYEVAAERSITITP